MMAIYHCGGPRLTITLTTPLPLLKSAVSMWLFFTIIFFSCDPRGKKRTPVLRESREYKWEYGSTVGVREYGGSTMGVREYSGSTGSKMRVHKEYNGLFYLFVIFYRKQQNKASFFVLNSYNDFE
jgi:hypothetical protein